ncbi:MAG: aspartate kinase [Ignavibacteria bacterium]|nr:aspartate kinase [Ignavibacteria bacterium]
MIVMKFGGTSVADSAALTSVLTIVTKTIDRSTKLLVVVSAASGTTNQLLELARMAVTDGDEAISLCKAIIMRHIRICNELIPAPDAACLDVSEIGNELTRYVEGIHFLNECTNQSLDKIASFGERFTSCILVHALRSVNVRCRLFDATSVMRTDDQYHKANVDFNETRRLCTRALIPEFDAHDVVVTQGYIGATPDGFVTTLGRGGSDYSAAILGSAVGAELIQIWTDVSGVFSADPRLVATARPIPSLSFSEVRELALYGARVLHPDTIKPAIDAGIAVAVLNTFRPDDEGTMITHVDVTHSRLHAVSIVRDCTFISGQTAELKNVLGHANIKSKILLESHSIERSSAVLISQTEESRTEIDVSLVGTGLEAKSASIIIATGPGATEASVLSAIATACTEHEIHELCNGMSRLSVFIVCRSESGADILNKIHGIVVN